MKRIRADFNIYLVQNESVRLLNKPLIEIGLGDEERGALLFSLLDLSIFQANAPAHLLVSKAVTQIWLTRVRKCLLLMTLLDEEHRQLVECAVMQNPELTALILTLGAPQHMGCSVRLPPTRNLSIWCVTDLLRKHPLESHIQVGQNTPASIRQAVCYLNCQTSVKVLLVAAESPNCVYLFGIRKAGELPIVLTIKVKESRGSHELRVGQTECQFFPRFAHKEH